MTQISTGQMPFLSPNQEHRSTEKNSEHVTSFRENHSLTGLIIS